MTSAWRFARAAVILCLLASEGRAGQGLTAAKIQEIERLIAAEMARQNIPGLSVAVAMKRKPLWAGGFGKADLENVAPASAQTVFRIASISKLITAAAALQLGESGKLDLDAPVQKYVPYFPEKQWRVTARHLLMHQGGIRHYRSQAEIDNTRHYDDLREPLRIIMNDPLLFEPGTRFFYSTYGYELLGAVVEGAAGMPFADYLRERIFVPSGMRHTAPDNLYEIVPHRARGYRRAPGNRLQNAAPADTSNKVPGGGIRSTVEDLVRFAIALHSDRLLANKTVEAMFTRQKTAEGKLTPYGLGCEIRESGGRRWVGHGGAQQGVRTLLEILPEEELVVVLMVNLEGAALEPLSDRIAAVLLR